MTARPGLSKFLLWTSALLGTASFSFALYVFPEAYPLWRRQSRPMPAPVEPGANLVEILTTRFRQAVDYLLRLDPKFSSAFSI